MGVPWKGGSNCSRLIKGRLKGGSMSIQERRKRPRNETELDNAVFIEIRHTFGPVRKSVYKVLEFNEYGTSFLVPTSDGYLSTGAPLDYSIVRDDFDKMENYGVVKYYHPYNDYKGNAFYKIGVENNPLTTKQAGNLRIRPERLRVTELNSEHAIYFSVEDQEFQFPLVDISRYSAAFICSEEEALSFSISSALESVEITFGDRMLFEGTVIITRRDLDGEKYRIVIEPRNTVFNIDAIEEQENLTSVSRTVDSLISTSKKHTHIDAGFKAVVADLRAFLEGYRQILDMPTASKLSIEADQTVFLNELNKTFYPQVDRYWEKMEKVVTELDLSEKDHGLYKSYVQIHLHPLMMAAPFCHRIYFKPLGYPGDYEMMRMIKEEGFEGPTLFSKLINKHALQIPLAQANRNRVGYLASRIAAFVEERDQPIVRLLSIASGPALEIQQLIEEYPSLASRIHITLLDQESEALRYSQDAIYMKRIMNNCSIGVELVHQSVGSFLKQVARGQWSSNKFDMIYIFGLFDYFDDRTCAFCINKSATLLEENGRMCVSNYSLDTHHHRTYMDYAFEWYMVYRDDAQMNKLADMVTLPCVPRVDAEPLGIIKFLELQFGSSH